MNVYQIKYIKESKEIKQNRTGTENFDICFYVIFNRCYQRFISGRETGR